MQVQRIDNLFNFTFEKSSEEIVNHAKAKVVAIRRKIEERAVRIKKMREEHKITDAVLIDIQNQMRAQQKRGEERMSYTSNAQTSGGDVQEAVTVGAGAINFLLTEQDHMDGEKAQVERLDMIIRNLKDLRRHAPDGKEYMRGHELNTTELKFLDF